ncbi:hypothetical protein BKA64DRAFT_686345 [Cadophora sp. MPI-SDFR-AT-0126]|nr:hypothetical protein BKA64DRAFT_686345 [Leotiomycetes sp. MPI-SDFR-AT-0126]
MESTGPHWDFDRSIAASGNYIYASHNEQLYAFADQIGGSHPSQANTSKEFGDKAIQFQALPIEYPDCHENSGLQMTYLSFVQPSPTMCSAPVMDKPHPAFDMNLDLGPTSVRASNVITTPANYDMEQRQWEVLKPIIYRLFIEETIKIEEVGILMQLVYHFRKTRNQYNNQFKKAGWEHFTKNSKTQPRTQLNGRNIAGTRTRQNKQSKAPSPLSDKLFNTLALRILTISKIASPDICRLQETILKSVHHITFGLFESEGWKSTDLFSITTKNNTSGLSSTWQSLSDQTFGAARLAKMSPTNLGQGVQKLHGIFEQMESTMICPDPAMLVKFWRMCRYMYDLCEVANDFTILSWFLGHYGEMTRSKLRPGCGTYPVFQICAALYHILQKDPDALIDSLRIGYLKSIHSLKTWVGGDHATVLAMWSNYLKHWDPDTLHHASLKESYQLLLRESDRRYGPNSESSLSILDRYTYFAHYSIREAFLAKELALALVERSRNHLPIDSGLQWCMHTQYFAFGSKVLAIASAQEGLQDDAKQSYSSAIAVLELGDPECQIRAAMLRGELAEYLEK